MELEFVTKAKFGLAALKFDDNLDVCVCVPVGTMPSGKLSMTK